MGLFDGRGNQSDVTAGIVEPLHRSESNALKLSSMRDCAKEENIQNIVQVIQNAVHNC